MIPMESEENNLFHLLHYCNRMQKPPGGVLDLQASKYVTYEAMKNPEKGSMPAKKLSYNIKGEGISEYLIDNRSAEKLERHDARRAQIAQPDKKNLELIESVADKTRSPGNDRAKTSSDMPRHKKRKGWSGVKEELRLRKQFELDQLLQMTESPQSRQNILTTSGEDYDFKTSYFQRGTETISFKV